MNLFNENKILKDELTNLEEQIKNIKEKTYR